MRTLEWVARYEAAWRTPGTKALRDVFAPRARYRQSPYHEPFIGLDAIGAMWEHERAGPDEAFTLTASVVAEQGDTAVVRAEVEYARAREYRGPLGGGVRRRRPVRGFRGVALLPRPVDHRAAGLVT